MSLPDVEERHIGRFAEKRLGLSGVEVIRFGVKIPGAPVGMHRPGRAAPHLSMVVGARITVKAQPAPFLLAVMSNDFTCGSNGAVSALLV